MSNELQNAFALSRSEYRSSCQAKEVEALRLQGKFILGCSGEVYCRFTDAVIATEDHIDSVHDSYEEAVAANGGEEPDDGYTWIASPKAPEDQVVYCDDSDAPF